MTETIYTDKIILLRAYLEPSQRSKMKLYAKINNGFQALNIFAKSSILDFWLDSE